MPDVAYSNMKLQFDNKLQGKIKVSGEYPIKKQLM